MGLEKTNKTQTPPPKKNFVASTLFYQACRSSDVEGMFPGGGRGGGPSEAELPYLLPPSMALISHIFLEAIVKLLERYHL